MKTLAVIAILVVVFNFAVFLILYWPRSNKRCADCKWIDTGGRCWNTKKRWRFLQKVERASAFFCRLFEHRGPYARRKAL